MNGALLAALAVCATWALSIAALNLPACGNAPYLACGSSAYNFVPAWATLLALCSGACAVMVVRGLPFAGCCTLAVAVAAGIVNRTVRAPMLYVSDVINATREALGVLAGGANPYLHDFLTTNPQHSPFPYLPGELLFYGIPMAVVHSIDDVDRWAGIGMAVVLACMAPLAGLGRTALAVALYATFGLAAATAVDGTNDGGAALLLVAAAVALAWSEDARRRGRPRLATLAFFKSAALLAWAILFKATTWPFVPFVALYLIRRDPAAARRYGAVVAGVCVVAIVPFLFPNPAGLLGNVYRGFVFNQYFYGLNLWTMLVHFGIPIDAASPLIGIVYAAGVVTAFAFALRGPIASVGEAWLRGLAVIATALALAHFATSSYWAFAGAILIAGWLLYPSPGANSSASELMQ